MELLPNGGISILIPNIDESILPKIGEDILVVARIDYEDTDNNPHTTGICFRFLTHLTGSKNRQGLPIVSETQVMCDIRGSNYAD
jgi:hypothetical protein